MRTPSPEEWIALQPLLDEALALSELEREQFVARQLGADHDLAEWVRAFLAGAADDAFLHTIDPAFVESAMQPDEADAFAGLRIGPYRLVREVGRGGMGTVYLAERADDQFEQHVALKLIQGSAPSAEARQRFLAERQILARLDHPNVARLVDGAVTPDGQPWFAMEFVAGEPIDDWCLAHRVNIEGRLRLFLTVCDAVQVAHQRLVIHRDLKPGNILVTHDGMVKLLDFGIAKLLDAGGADATRTGRLSFTPEYASPEQWRGEPVTTGSDVYSLGVILHELLTGVRPHRLRDRPESEWREIVLGGDSAPASSLVDAMHAGQLGAPMDRLRRALRGDLDTIVRTALHVDQERRYPTVSQLAADIRRHLGGLPIGARPDTWRYRSVKFVRRNRVAVVAGTLVLGSVIAGAVATAVQAQRASREARRTASVRTFLESTFAQADPEHARGDSLTAGEMLDRARRALDTAFVGDHATRVDLLLTLGRIYRDLGRLGTADSVSGLAVEVARDVDDASGAATAGALGLRGSVKLARGEFPEADTLLRAAIRLWRDAANDSALTRALDGHGAVLRRMGQLEQSERTYREAIAIAGRGKDSVFLGTLWGNLSAMLADAGRMALADSAIGRALAIHQRVLPPDDPGLLLFMGNQAAYKSVLWQLDSARQLLESVVARQKRIYPNGHERVAIALNNLAFIDLRREDWSRAEAQFREAHAMVDRLFGAEYLSTLIMRNNIGRTLLLAGRPAEAEATVSPVLATARRVLGADHPWPSLPMLLLARARAAQGRLDAATPLLQEALALAKRGLPPTHARAAEVEAALGMVALRAGRPADAVAPLRAALQWQVAHHPPLEPETAETALQLARTLAALGQRAEADSLFVDGAERLGRNPYRVSHAAAARSELESYRRRWGGAARDTTGTATRD